MIGFSKAVMGWLRTSSPGWILAYLSLFALVGSAATVQSSASSPLACLALLMGVGGATWVTVWRGNGT